MIPSIHLNLLYRYTICASACQGAPNAVTFSFWFIQATTSATSWPLGRVDCLLNLWNLWQMWITLVRVGDKCWVSQLVKVDLLIEEGCVFFPSATICLFSSSSSAWRLEWATFLAILHGSISPSKRNISDTGACRFLFSTYSPNLWTLYQRSKKSQT